MNAIYNKLEELNKEELQQFFEEDFVKQCVAKYKEFKEIFDPYLITNDVDKMPYEEWVYVINRMKHEGVVLKNNKPKEPTFERKSIIDKYTYEELAKLYSINCIPAITQFFINELKSKKHMKGNTKPFINLSGWGSHYQSIYENEATIYNMASKTADNELNYGNQRTNTEILKLKIQRQACLAISQILMDEKEQPEIFDFVCNNLQYAPLDELEKLSQLYRSGFKDTKQGRPKKNEPKKTIIMYDSNGEIEDRFENRQACIEIMGIKKSMLSQVLSGKKLHWKGYIFKEVEIEES